MLRSIKHKSFAKKHLTLLLLTGCLVIAVVAAALFFTWPSTNTNETQNNTPSPSQTSEPSDGQTNQDNTEAENPSSGEPVTTPGSEYSVITENEQYKIQRDSQNKNYIITLYAIINNPSQYDTYREQLREYKRNALDYLTGQGVDTTKVNITYEPPEATDL